MGNLVIAIIPARGGSKGVPRKNIKLLGGKPLVAWTIGQALACSGIDRVVVSTDDPEIAEISRDWGAEVPFLRPAHLATDACDAGTPIQHALGQMQVLTGWRVGAVLSLYPSHPFRTLHMLDTAVRILSGGDCGSFATVRRIATPACRYVVLDQDVVRPIAATHLAGEHCRPYGLVTGNSLPYRPGICEYTVSHEACLVDIDEPDDFRRAEAVLDKGLYDFHAA